MHVSQQHGTQFHAKELQLEGPPKLITLKKRLDKRIDNLWVFLKHYNVAADTKGKALNKKDAAKSLQ